MREKPIRVALPNKGRLAKRSLELFEHAGLKPAFRADRALVASLGEDFQAIFARPADIPEYIADGAAEIGVTGADLIAEGQRNIVDMLDLRFGKCRLVVAVEEDSDINFSKDLPPGTRVATSFPRCSLDYFESLGIPIEIAKVSGSTEIAPHLGVSDVIVDLTSTGSTLRVHGLKEIDTILHSSSRLVASRAALSNPQISRMIEVREVLPGLSGPTIVEVLDSGSWVAAHGVVGADLVYETITRLKNLGAEGILVTQIERLVP